MFDSRKQEQLYFIESKSRFIGIDADVIYLLVFI